MGSLHFQLHSVEQIESQVNTGDLRKDRNYTVLQSQCFQVLDLTGFLKY